MDELSTHPDFKNKNKQKKINQINNDAHEEIHWKNKK